MNSNNSPEQAKKIFEQALDLGSAEARLGYLKGACGGDAELLERVQTLLRAHDESGGFLPENPSRTTVSSPGIEEGEKPGTMIGRYKLLQKIGEGGCGSVYMAEQQEPVRRRVALKVIKLGLDTKEVIARFDAERQALALMDHPNIAKVLDGGSTASGRPYFVMELVRGIPITRYCDENNLSTERRLTLFTSVCHAIQHAHQKGIIHRDLKPSNVLVTENDGAPVPKVIDFGIAKATQSRLTDATLFTAFGQFIGTPAYMSPEQAAMTSLDVDTRSDIYSLGVMLYELLSGSPPFDPKTFAQAGIDEFRRIIREVDPPRPSIRLGTLADGDRATVARLRRTALSQLSSTLSGDLDWIVMRCLEKDRSRRFESAGSLADDINRYIRNEPVAARPPTTAYLIQKTIKRHRLAFIAFASILISLVLCTVFSTWAFLRQERAIKLAVDSSRKSDEIEKGTLSLSAAQKLADVHQARGEYSLGLLEKLTEGRPWSQRSEEDRAATLLALNHTEARLKSDAHFSSPKERQELFEALADCYVFLNMPSSAEPLLREVLATRRVTTGPLHPKTISVREKLLKSLQLQGKTDELEKIRRESTTLETRYRKTWNSVTALRNESREYRRHGQYAQAVVAAEAAFAAARAHFSLGPYNYARLQSDVAFNKFLAMDQTGARATVSRLVETRPDRTVLSFASPIVAVRSLIRELQGKDPFFINYSIEPSIWALEGLVALRDDDVERAAECLLASVKNISLDYNQFGESTPFGSLLLARELAKANQMDSVQTFLNHFEQALSTDLISTGSIGEGLQETVRARGYIETVRQDIVRWRSDLKRGIIPADWTESYFPKDIAVTLPPSVTTADQPRSAPSKWIGAVTRRAANPLAPLIFTAVGWFSAALAGGRTPGSRTSPNNFFLPAFFGLRSLEVTILAGAIYLGVAIPTAYYASIKTVLYVSVYIVVAATGWAALWAHVRSEAPQYIERWEKLTAHIIGSLIVIGFFVFLSSYLMVEVLGFDSLGRLGRLWYKEFLPLLLLFAAIPAAMVLVPAVLSVTLVLRAARGRLQPSKSHGPYLLGGVPVLLIAIYGLSFPILPVIHDQGAKPIALALFWLNALIPWALAYLLSRRKIPAESHPGFLQ